MQENTPADPTPQDIQRLNAIRQHFEQERQKRAEYCEQAKLARKRRRSSSSVPRSCRVRSNARSRSM